PRALNPRISPHLEAIILKCLDKDPDRRYQSAKELLVDLRRLQLNFSSGLLPLPARLPASTLWKRIAYAAAAALVLIAALVASNFAGWRDRLLGRSRPLQIRSLAVLPFQNLSGNSDQDYFADGMTEALITNLGQIHALHVISRTSVTRYKSPQKPLRQIAQELHVDAIVEGSVSLIGGVAQVNARLLYGPTDTQLWSKSYKRDLQNVLVLQAELGSSIVHEINLTVTPQEQARLAGSREVNPAAHEAYLKGNFLKRGTPEQREKSREYFEEAIRIDPNYAPAYAGLADYYRSSSELTPLWGMRESENYAEKAVALDPALAHAHLALGSVRFFGQWNWAQAEIEFKRALELNPSDAEAHRTYANFLAALGRQEEALSEIHHAQELDPLYITTQITAGWVLYFARQYDKAIEQCRGALELDPNSAGGYDCLGNAFLAKGVYEQAVDACQKAVSFSGNASARVVGLGEAYAFAGKKAQAGEVLRQLHERSAKAYVSPVFLSRLYLASGNQAQALAQLELAYRARDQYMVWLNAERAFDPLRGDARFQDLVGRVGFPK
ncbi:MAG TPA: tetratricopeptide repeat protein, partial [Candidatus Acidoferrum sp.]